VSHATSRADTVENATVEAEHIPVDMSTCPDSSIPEPVDLIKFEMLLGEPGDEDTPARRAEIDRDDACRPRGRHDAVLTPAAD
jgi:hypothetical protein